MIFSKKQPYLILAILIIIALGFTVYTYLKPVEPVNPPPPPSNGTTQEGHYRNEEYGFEFDYPERWSVRDDIFLPTHYSKLTLVVTSAEQYPSPILVNVVLPEFSESSFQNQEGEKMVVNGVEGQKYEYEFEGRQQVAVILPMGEFSVILGNHLEKYREEFNQFLDSFKFIK